MTILMSLPGTLPAASIASMAPSAHVVVVRVHHVDVRVGLEQALHDGLALGAREVARLRGDDLDVGVALRGVAKPPCGRWPARSPCALSSTTLMGSVPSVVGDVLADALALLDEVGPDERLVERRVLGVDRAVGQDDGDVRRPWPPRGRRPSRTRPPARTRCSRRPGRCSTGSPGSGSPASAARRRSLRSNPSSAVRVSLMDLVLAARQPLSEPTWLKPTLIASPPSDCCRGRRSVPRCHRCRRSLAQPRAREASAATPAAIVRVLNFLLTIVILLLENGWLRSGPRRPGRAVDPRHGIRSTVASDGDRSQRFA